MTARLTTDTQCLNKFSITDSSSDHEESKDTDLRRQLLQNSPQSFRMYANRDDRFKKLHEARDKREMKLPSLEARQSRGY